MLPFIKMNGAGNDFVIFDARKTPIRLTPAQVQRIAARGNATTKGCDQVIVMERPKASGFRIQDSGSKESSSPNPESRIPTPDIFMRIYNADGSEVDACGNATRCVAELLEKELGRLPVTIQTNAGVLRGVKKENWIGRDTLEKILLEEYILVDMGIPQLAWEKIPLAMPKTDAAARIQQLTGLKDPMFVSMGNPHVIFFPKFEPDYEADQQYISIVDGFLDKIGPTLERAKEIFPEGANVSVAVPYTFRHGIGYRFIASTWERGAGFTNACGTAACAILVAANQRDIRIRKADVVFNHSNQSVIVALDDKGHVLLGGPIKKEFLGELEL